MTSRCSSRLRRRIWRYFRLEHTIQEPIDRPRADLAAGTAEDVIAAVRRPGESHVRVERAARAECGGEEFGVRVTDELVAAAVDEECGHGSGREAQRRCAIEDVASLGEGAAEE